MQENNKKNDKLKENVFSGHNIIAYKLEKTKRSLTEYVRKLLKMA